MFSKIFPKIHAEGYKFLVIAGIITIIFYIFSSFLGLIGLVLTIWVYYFFRDPDRIIINDDNYLVSPADGEVIRARSRSRSLPYFSSRPTPSYMSPAAWLPVIGRPGSLRMLVEVTKWLFLMAEATGGRGARPRRRNQKLMREPSPCIF